jgi:toxin-antitoxin system PIN domain toxin
VTRIALLDVNALIALFDPDHINHDAAHTWFAANRDAGWATCPLTENGLVRVLANAAYTGTHETADMIRARLSVFCASGHHVFWSDAVSLRDERFDLTSVTSRQLTDVYLVGLAVDRGGRLATFDRGIPFKAVVGADRETLALIPA